MLAVDYSEENVHADWSATAQPLSPKVLHADIRPTEHNNHRNFVSFPKVSHLVHGVDEDL